MDTLGKDGSRKPPKPAPDKPHWGVMAGYAIVMLVVLWLWQDVTRQAVVRTLPYSQFKALLAKGAVTQCEVGQDEITGRIVPAAARHSAAPAAATEPAAAHRRAAPPAARTAAAHNRAPAATQAAAVEAPYLFRTVRVEDPKLVDELQAEHVKYAGVRPSLLSQFLWAWVIPIGGIVLLWTLLSRGLRGAGTSAFSFGKSRAKLVADKSTGVTFGDVAGAEEAKTDLQEVIDFLKNPARYKSLGAEIPKGVLLIGPPGTGKTLLARAVAGEAGVPFFSLSGSDFVEMFVGVGAARVRDLFEQAKSQAPCIVFIDELDAIGAQRGVHLGTVNDEREQTLDALLVQMDGFEANLGVIILAATNRPEVLDRALLRPGRFDRQVLVDSPDLDDREAILNVHARNKPLGPDVDLRRIAQSTPGFSGADLANAINEAALLAARRKSNHISQRDLDDAIEKVVAGPERRSRRLGAEEKRRVAYHEVGHALVAAFSPHADPLHKISIVPRGRAALGYTMHLPADQHFLISRAALIEQLRALLGGRAAEELVFGEMTTGAANDLEKATALARQMVCIYGMSSAVGLTHCGQQQSQFLGPAADGPFRRDCSEHTAEMIDTEVKGLLDQVHAQARSILEKHRDKLERIAEELLARETLDRQEFERLLAEAGGPLAAWNGDSAAPPDAARARRLPKPAACPEPA